MLRISQLMEPSEPSEGGVWGQHNVSEAVAVTDSLGFFKEQGLFYQEDATVGAIVNALDAQGLSGTNEGFKFFTGYLVGDAVCGKKKIIQYTSDQRAAYSANTRTIPEAS
ncbi:hypothetical protein MAC_05240 [Metarhizium acridum CQMa 102]|uniref:Uncharacterized protein n=1 Tax=Metarhizium acridum (strain CQMa 102) TaxID=655827 RepID=E9E5U2_METAQ|nr:uncharacterized protein MAC_05240 [Metarhizium acridum CQMa 102]EFY88805.1 hypothetical protein MAC_05240 [Metarhizium acridum CQMa 102]